MLEETNKGAKSAYQLQEKPKAYEVAGSSHIAKEYLPKLFSELGIGAGAKILDVGCGIGAMVGTLRQIGYDAYGLEPGGRFNEVDPALRQFIYNCYADEYGANENRYTFDLVMSFGVIEHVGTTDGHSTLTPNFREYRKQFLEDSINLLKPGGFLVVMGPNRLFPFDFQHGPHRYGLLDSIKRNIRFTKALHKLTIPWHTENYLVSYDDLSALGNEISQKSGHEGSYLYLCPKQSNLVGLSSLEGKKRIVALFRLYIRLIDKLPTKIRKFFYTHTLFVLKRPSKL